MTWLLKLYPREWRRRYGAEFEEVVSSQPRTLQLAVDLIGGAVDAHLKPQAFARRVEQSAAGRGGTDMVNRLLCCGNRGNVTRKDALIGGALTLGSALVIAGVMLLGRNPMTESIGLVMFPGVLAVGTQWTYLRGHSGAAKLVQIGGMFGVLFLIGLATGYAAN